MSKTFHPTRSLHHSIKAVATLGLLNLALLAALSAGTVHAAQKPSSSLKGKKVLLVIQMKGPNRPVDDKVKEHLESLGFVVTVADQTDTATKAGGQDLVVISSTVSAHVLEGAYRNTLVPVFTWESNILDDMGMSGKKLDRDFGEVARERHIWMVNAPHPLSAGRPAGVLNVYQKNAAMNWGKPGLGATVIATLPGEPEKAAIFAYEKGATMDYEFIAPARRVMFFLDNESFVNLNEASLSLFDAAVRWLVGMP